MYTDSIVSGSHAVNTAIANKLTETLSGLNLEHIKSVCAFSFNHTWKSYGHYKYELTIDYTEDYNETQSTETYSVVSTNSELYDAFNGADLDSEEYNEMLLDIISHILSENLAEIKEDIDVINSEAAELYSAI